MLYVSIDTPLYSNISLEAFLAFVPSAADDKPCLVVFDEIQYLKDWQVHLKDLVDSYPNVKFIASGSAAAALKLQSQESGAGRFSDFMLPPLTFSEYIEFSNQEHLVQVVTPSDVRAADIGLLNKAFIDYLNFGGYPEAVFNEIVRNNPDQFIRTDIIEKVLLKDLPSLYGISDIQELNKLFLFLAYNAGNEASYEHISQSAGVSKETIKKYIGYLESAFLIIKVPVVNQTCKSMQRERNFKVYLNNPSMRAALFSPVEEKDTAQIGHLAESAVFSQWQHSSSFKQLRYARWKTGEVDVVYLLEGVLKPRWVGEVKWSDHIQAKPYAETKNMRFLLERHASIKSAFYTTKTHSGTMQVDGRRVNLMPTSIYSYMVGRNITSESNLLNKFGLPPMIGEGQEDEESADVAA